MDSLEEQKTRLDVLEKKRKRVLGLWRNHSKKNTEWRRYFIEYQFTGLRWLIALAATVLSISSVEFLPGSSTENDQYGAWVLFGFIVCAVIFDRWRTNRVIDLQEKEGAYTQNKLSDLQSNLIGKIHSTMQGKPIDIQEAEEYAERKLIEWFNGLSSKDSFEQFLDRAEEWVDLLLLIAFTLGVALLFLF